MENIIFKCKYCSNEKKKLFNYERAIFKYIYFFVFQKQEAVDPFTKYPKVREFHDYRSIFSFKILLLLSLFIFSMWELNSDAELR